MDRNTIQYMTSTITAAISKFMQYYIYVSLTQNIMN